MSDERGDAGNREPAKVTDVGSSLQDFILNSHRLAIRLGEAPILADHDIGLSEWAILSSLAEDHEVPLAALQKSSGLSRQRIRKLLGQMERKGLLQVQQSTATDKRVRSVSITDRSKEISAAISQALQDLGSLIGGDKGAKTMAKAASLSRRLSKTLKPRGRKEQGAPNRE